MMDVLSQNTTTAFALLSLVLSVVLISVLTRRRREVDAPAPTQAPAQSSGGDPGEETNLFAIAASLDDHYEQSATPRDMLEHKTFLKGVGLLHRGERTAQALLDYASGANPVIACMALEGLAGRTDDTEILEPILAGINEMDAWPAYFALRALNVRVKEPLIGRVLARLDYRWSEAPRLRTLREFIAMRVAAVESPTFGSALDELAGEKASTLESLVEQLKGAVPAPLAEEFARWRDGRVDTGFLKGIGRVWPDASAEDGASVVLTDAVAKRVAELELHLRKNPPRSLLLVGDTGVGKTTLARLLARRLRGEGWTIFEAGAVEVNAGMCYIGELEERVQQLARKIGGKKVLWLVPNFPELFWTGQHRYSPAGALDLLLPHIESGELRVIGETDEIAYEQLVQARPRVPGALITYRVSPLPEKETLEMARRWAAQVAAPGGAPRLAELTLREAFRLAQHYLGDKEAPGNLLHLLAVTHQRLVAVQGSAEGQIALADLLGTISELTGLPLGILDDRQALDLVALRAFFQGRVLGQPEAVDCLVERVAMLKAGLTDPTRPQGVFLFVGPTGTGKTEIAKTLAEFLFGSPDRMIRLDMSEFQEMDSLDRILGKDSERAAGTALVNAIRKQPFAVVLLDEFEKAHPNVWNLFLQVFDDGRLTDRRGNTADFRHCIVVMTSNLGAAVSRGASVGFTQEGARFSQVAVQRAVAKAFRPELLNRLDRVVVFQPLGRSVIREILHKELKEVLGRRGLRNRAWAVEWAESALEFLLEKGITPDLGARPLKRAIEQYLLSPLALTIVNRQVPEGDQFLFLRTDGERIEAVFVDPDVPEREVGEPAAIIPAEVPGLRVEAIALEARGTAAEVDFLEAEYLALAEQVQGKEWEEHKQEALSRMGSSSFWESPGRFAVLGLAEYMDRIEAGFATAGSLLQRLGGSQRRGRRHSPQDLIQRLAQQIYLLKAACAGLADGRPRDAFLSVSAGRDVGEDAAASEAFARRLGQMYGLWAKARGMRCEILEEVGAGAETPYRLLLAVSGFAAFVILGPEAGLHVLEMPQEEKSFNRVKARVGVVAQPEEPAGHGQDSLRQQAVRAFAAVKNPSNIIVRRYREEPSPLVRDSVRQWRTGRFDLVLAGNFDLMF